MWFKNRKSKFARRLTWRIILIFTLCNILIFSSVIWVIFFLQKGQAEYHARGMINNINGPMETMVTMVEVSARNNVYEVEENLSSPDKVFETLEKELRLNPHYLGCFVAFEASYYPSQGRWFEPYVFYSDSAHIERRQVGSAKHDYLNREWYIKGLDSDSGYWSQPYYDMDVTDLMMCSYVRPVHDRDGRRIGVFGVDIPLEWLADLMDEQMEKIFSDSFFTPNEEAPDSDIYIYSFIIGRHGQYIVHPNKDRVLKDNYGEDIHLTTDTLDDVAYRKMLAGESSMLDEIKSRNDKTYYISYAPISHTGWTIAVVQDWWVIYIWAVVISALIIVIVIIGALITFFTTHFTVWRSTKPLLSLTKSVNEISQGNFNTPLPVIRHNDEIRQLRDSFESMQHSLVNYMEELQQTTALKASVENELKIAHDIQMAMLPKTFPPFPERTDVEIYGELFPAKAVGGDLYDFYIRDEKLFFCIGDVAGKGIPASLVMAVTRSLFRNISAHTARPEEIASTLNDSLNEGNSTSIFVTFFVGVLDLPTGCLRYCNAGHDAPFLIDSNSKYTKLPVKSHLPLAAMPEWEYTCQQTTMTPGTTIFLFTDGLVEAENKEHQQFKMERLQQVLSAGTIHPDPLVKRVRDAVHQFVDGAEQSDDLTMMAIMYAHKHNDVKLERELTLRNDIQETPLLGTFVEDICEALDFDAATTMKMNLAIEEAVVNVMNYAYPDGELGEVRIRAEANDSRLKFIISDDGKPFDPTAHGLVDINQSAEDREIGGLGIHLMRQIMDSINYERVDGHNVFTLRKRLG